MPIRYGFRTYHSICPFCKKRNVVWDGTVLKKKEVEKEQRCSHYFSTVEGGREPDMIFRFGPNQKSGI